MGIISPAGLLNSWGEPRPGDAGISEDITQRLTHAFARGEFPGLHALLVVRNGILASEQHFPGRDENWGQQLGTIEHAPAMLHDLRSVTKSIVSLCYGIALGQGLVPPVSTALLAALPEYGDLFADVRKRRIRIGHVLSMRMGLSWMEDLAYADPLNGERLMEAAPDRIRYVLGLAMAEAPGKHWVYCGGATVLLSHLIERGTGLRLEDFAQQHLFTPLGIDNVAWSRWPDGGAAASSGLRLTGRDLARVGQMLLDKGLWRQRRVVPASWIAASLKPRAFAEPGLRYGYQWWLGQLSASGKPWYAAYGNGGQRLIIVPSLKLVIVVFAGNYNAADQWKMPVKLMSRIVLPSVQ